MADTRSTGSKSSVASFMEGPIGIITVSGEVGIDAGDQLQEAYNALTNSSAKRIRFRFAPRTTINSSGIAVLITLTAQARKARQTVEVDGLTPHYRKIFDMIGLTDYLKIVD